MLKIIRDTYEKSVDSDVVDRFFGNEIGSGFIGGLIVVNNKDVLLTEAKRLEKIEQDKQK